METPGTAETGSLGEFLRGRRARLTPHDAGITSYGTRRVPGLRREELAQLAGVSSTYYTRLEQGQSTNASDAVIDAIARALNLNQDERAHLHHLARPVRAKRRRPQKPDFAPASTVRLIEAFVDVPALIMGPRSEVLAWNRLAHALLAGHLDFTAPTRPADRPNLTRLLFRDPHTRELYARWDDEAARSVASLHLIAGNHRDDPGLADLIGELVINSPEFCALWSKHPVHNCQHGEKHFHHPEVGDFTLEFQVLNLPDERGQRMLTYIAPPGTPAEAALRLLAGVHANDQGEPTASLTSTDLHGIE